MAGKSAKSKGYRQYKEAEMKKAREKENKTLITGIIVFVVAILVVAIGIKVYDNYGTLKVVDYVVQDVEDNWIIKNFGTSNDPKVYKVAEVAAPAAGYALQPADRNVRQTQVNYYRAEDEANPIQGYYVTVGTGEYDELAQGTYGSVAAYGDIISMSEIKETEIAGMKVAYYHSTYSMDYSQAADGSDIRYIESLNAYFDSKFNGYSVLVSVGDQVADENSFNAEEDLMKVLEEIAGNLKMCKRGE